MLDATYWQYEHLEEDGKIKVAPINDYNGKITGKHVYGVKQYFDENPDEARRLGWIKHIMHNTRKYVQYNHQTQYLTMSHKIIDEYTYEDVYEIREKTEAMMRAHEEGADADSSWVWSGDGFTIDDEA